MRLRAVSDVERTTVLQRAVSQGAEIFNIDPRRHNLAGLSVHLHEMGAALFVVSLVDDAHVEDAVAVAAHVVNPLNRRQVRVSIAALMPERGVAAASAQVDSLVDTFGVNSFLASGPVDSDVVEIYRAAGFTEVGRMNSHRYRDYGYHDECILHMSRTKEGAVFREDSR